MTIAEIKKCWKDNSCLVCFLFFFKKKSNLHKLFYKLALEHQDIFPGVQLLQILF